MLSILLLYCSCFLKDTLLGKIVVLPSTLVGKCLGGGNVFDWQGANRDKL